MNGPSLNSRRTALLPKIAMPLSSDPLSVVPPDREQVEMTLARGAALREYVALEGAMFRIYAFLVGKDPDLVSAEFWEYKSHQRIAKLRELISARTDLGVDVFFSSLLDDIESLTQMRNFIVHAQQIAGAEEINLANGRRRRWTARLIPPDHSGLFANLRMNSAHDVVSAVRRFAYVSACLNELHHYFVMRTVDGSTQTPAHFGGPHERVPKPEHRHYWQYAFEQYKAKD